MTKDDVIICTTAKASKHLYCGDLLYCCEKFPYNIECLFKIQDCQLSEFISPLLLALSVVSIQAVILVVAGIIITKTL